MVCKEGDEVIEHNRLIKSGDSVMLMHLVTRFYLHTHKYRSPITNQHEVCAVQSPQGNGSVWKIGLSKDKVWKQDSPVTFQSKDTYNYLFVNSNAR